jgi:glycosyltransferase involved in cell wall biosynthesis
MTIKISVVMAAYNAADFLSETIDSIINQNFTEWELICINDGSTDNSLEILEDYASKDKRITFFDIQNSGALNARNFGVDKVRSEWLFLMDADDKISSDMLGEMYSTAISENADFVLPDQIHWFPHKETETFSFNKKFGVFPNISSRDAFLKYLKWEIHGRGMMKTNLYREHSFNYDRFFIDEFIIRKIVLNCKKIAFSKGEYIYRQNDESLIYKASKRRFDVLERSRMSEDLLLENFDNKDVIAEFRTERLLEIYGLLILFLGQKKQFSKQDSTEILRFIEVAYKKLDKRGVRAKFLNNGNKGKLKSILFCSNWKLFKNTTIILKKL